VVRCTVLGIAMSSASAMIVGRTLRLLARELNAMALVPAVVVRDEIRDGVLWEYGAVPDLLEEFHAIRVTRQHQPPLLRALLPRRPTEWLGEGS
jgi:LysR family transcriptional activator of nhaA